jgi:hypothetical protein
MNNFVQILYEITRFVGHTSKIVINYYTYLTRTIIKENWRQQQQQKLVNSDLMQSGENSRVGNE